MKVITKCIIDMATLNVVAEDSYDYNGLVIECKGGGGGGSGAVSYPAYMQAIHENWLDQNGADSITQSVTDVMNAAFSNSPWATATAYSPDADLTAAINATDDLQTLVNLLSSGTTLDTLISNVLDDSRIDNAVNEFSADLGDRLVSEVIPRFERGMQDINAVMSSAFVIGRALIEKNQERQVSKYAADLHMKAFSDDAIKVIGLKLEYQRIATNVISEVRRVKIVAKKEENELNAEYDEKDALWDLETFQYGANLLASIGGGTAGTKIPSKKQSAIGGALSGAAAGAMISGGNPIGAAIGGVLGAASAFI